MMYICTDCGNIFDEEDAEIEVADIEEELGVGGCFGDHHTCSYNVCPECFSGCIEEYEEEEEEEEYEEDDES